MSRLFDEMFALPIRGTCQNPITPRTRLITNCFGNSSPLFSNLPDSFTAFLRCLDEDRTEHRKTIALTNRFCVVYSIKYLENLRTYALYRCMFGAMKYILHAVRFSPLTFPFPEKWSLFLTLYRTFMTSKLILMKMRHNSIAFVNLNAQK